MVKVILIRKHSVHNVKVITNIINDVPTVTVQDKFHITENDVVDVMVRDRFERIKTNVVTINQKIVEVKNRLLLF
jgi:hypothetical protein